ncbi:MAG TPA: hypothetical protein VL326_08690 [Kofleriaceae bacterium]|nr:hypothetical protein [Kofleriaceae bacterium]
MRMLAWVLIVAACSSSKSPTSTNQPPVVPDRPAQAIDAALPVDAAAPPIDAAAPATADDKDDRVKYPAPRDGTMAYRSDCSMTHPIARNPCDAVMETRGLKTCKALQVKMNKPCKKGAPTCYVEMACGDGRVVPSDFLECAAQQSGTCFTRSSRIYKEDIAYLDDSELAALATQIEQLKLARYRYIGEPGKRVGFIIEDAPDAPWVSADGRRIDLYSLLSASIATLQQQDARIRQLERDIETCK